MKGTLKFTAVGDVFLPGTVHWSNGHIDVVDPEFGNHIMDDVKSCFLDSDVNFVNLESSISDFGMPASGRAAAFHSYAGTENLLKEAKISFVSLANNHTQDYGWESLSDTIDRLDKIGIGHSGAGKNLNAAKAPAIFEVEGKHIGMIAYTANVNTPMGFKASPSRQGLNPMRISPYFLPDQITREDLEAMVEDVKKWSEELDFLALSFHWGISEGGTHTVCHYQEVIAHAAIDAGADMIIGHHPHALQPVEIYKGKPILYSLGNFIFALDEDFPRESCMFQCEFSSHEVKKMSFVPTFNTMINKPGIFKPGTVEGDRVISLMDKLCAKYNVKLTVDKEKGEVICSV